MTDTAGRSTALTFITPLGTGGRPWGRLLFGAARRVSSITAPLRTMSLIHFARWTVLDRLPGDTKKLRHPVLLFESNFDGQLWRYVDAFAYVLGWRMRAVWWRAFGYPGLLPTDAFTAFTERNRAGSDHYYCAYPSASPTMVRSALIVHRRVARFSRTVHGLSDAEFAREYGRLVNELQGHL